MATLGTSLSAGGLWQDDLRTRIIQCLRKPHEALEILNFGQGGAASRWGVEQVDTVAAAKPDAVLIEFAINDAYERSHTSLEDSYRNTAAIVAALRSALPYVRILLVTTNPAPSNERPQLPSYYAQYRTLARDLGVELIDLFPLWSEALSRSDGERLIPDGVHPTREAYRQVATAVLVRRLTLGSCATGAP